MSADSIILCTLPAFQQYLIASPRLPHQADKIFHIKYKLTEKASEKKRPFLTTRQLNN